MTRTLLILMLAALGGAARADGPAKGEPLTLEQALATARARQPSLRAAQAEVRAAAARVTQANAPLLPQAAATAGWTRAGPTSPILSSETFSLGLAGSQTLFDAAGWYRSKAARAAAAAEVETGRSLLLQVALDVKTAWYLAAAARDLVAVARETLANREAHLKQVEGFVEVGTRPEIDLAQARSDRASAVVQLIGAENDYATARAQLNLAMGVTGPLDFELADAEVTPLAGEEAPLEALLSEALAARPDQAARARLREAQLATLRSAQASFAPTAAAGARISDVGGSPSDLSRSWSFGLTLTWSFLEGGRSKGLLDEAQANLDSLDATDEGVRQQIQLALETDRLAVRAAKATLEATREVVVNARERLRLAEGRYQAGLGSGLELSDAQVALTTAAAQEVKSRFSLASARALLANALGRA